ncbi:MAG: TetR/AcrR family transcriptional regulator [Microthrixaceae bacterium]
MSRPSAQDRRNDYLDIAMDILTRFTPEQSADATVDALAHVLIADVAERAGVTKGAIYHVWPSQEAFRRDLLAKLLDRSRRIGVQQLAQLVEAGKRSDGDPVPLLHQACNLAFDSMKNDPLYFAQFSFYLYASNPEVRDLLAVGDENLLAQFGGAVELFLELLGRRVREPFTIETIVTTCGSLLMGLCLRYRTSAETIDGYRQLDPTIPSRFATGLESICMHFSEPVAAQTS